MSTADELRNKVQLYYDDIKEGQTMPPLVLGPMTSTHIFRWSAAVENWGRIHYDENFSIYHEGLPAILVNGSWKQSILPRYLKDICLPDGWLWKVSFQHRAMIVAGDTITCWAAVTGKYEKDGLGFVELNVGMSVQTGVETCPGKATIVLPIRGGRPVPYPFMLPGESPGRSEPGAAGRQGPLVGNSSTSDASSTSAKQGDVLSDEIRAMIGVRTEKVPASLWGIEREDLRRFTQAIMDPDPRYWDDDFARTTRFAGIVTPPIYCTYLRVKSPPGEDDPITRTFLANPNSDGGVDFRSGRGAWPAIPTSLKRSLNAGTEIEVYKYPTLGDLVFSQGQYKDIKSRVGKDGNPFLIITSETNYTDQNGQPLCTLRGSSFRR